MSDKGITITTLCPGATETGFQAAGAMEESELFKGKKLAAAKEVAGYGYDSMIKATAVAIHGMMNYIMSNSIRFIPRAAVLKVSRKLLDRA